MFTSIFRAYGMQRREQLGSRKAVDTDKAHVGATHTMLHNIRTHLTGYSGLCPLPPAGDAGVISHVSRKKRVCAVHVHDEDRILD